MKLADLARLPVARDNCAIATKRIDQGTVVESENSSFTISHTVLVGHRFAVAEIPAGQHLYSWQMPFGTASRTIQPGDYLCNQDVLDELRQHQLDFELPAAPNFSDDIPSFALSADTFTPAPPLPRYTNSPTFRGFQRAGGRGVGTRNHVVLLAVNGNVAGFLKTLATELEPLTIPLPNVDGIAAAVHTEGITADSNNRELLLRTLAGYIVHPNTGAVLIVDNGRSGLSGSEVRDYLRVNGYALDHVRHHFFSTDGPFAAKQREAADIVRNWLPQLNLDVRSDCSVAELKIALQCGGSDAFSGISGNPLIAWVARELIRHGGAANLAETDELQGAEAYVLSKVRDAETASRFIDTVERFKRWAEQHGHSATANPSGGNRYRGLYNIYIKSLGAATKRHPDVPLDFVIDYSVPMDRPGFYFMDSPGNDLESIAGQVGSGCNLIFFVTGNGSITNFPFVPTLKVVTTTERYELLAADMDIDAGPYLTGRSMDDLGAATWEHFLQTASGQRTVGENAGHAQLQIWREWRLAGDEDKSSVTELTLHSDRPIPIRNQFPPIQFADTARKPVALILPTSLCSGQIARMAVAGLNRQAENDQFARYATLVHTEGCGTTEQAEFLDTMLGYMIHPLVGSCLLLEHGCEKTHNSYWRQKMRSAGLALDQYGWASIQGDGGIDKSMARVGSYFARGQQLGHGQQSIRLGLIGDLPEGAENAARLAAFVGGVIAGGGSIIIPENAALLGSKPFRDALGVDHLEPNLRFAGWDYEPGLRIMVNPAVSWTETLTGLGAAGSEIMISLANQPAFNGHPLVPLLQIGWQADAETDLSLEQPDWAASLTDLVRQTRAGRYEPVIQRQNNVDFQITRGLLGISL